MTKGRFFFIAAIIVALIGSAILISRDKPDLTPSIVAGSMLASMFGVATPLTLGMLAGLYCERSGVVNIAIEGMMLTAAFVGFTVASYTQSLWIGLFGALLSSGLMALLHAWLSVTFKVDQIISGTVINILAAGLTGYFNDLLLRPVNRDPPRSAGLTPTIHQMADMPVIGLIFTPIRGAFNWMDEQGGIWTVIERTLNQKPIAILSLILVVVTHYVLFKTTWGLRTRAVGEHPRAADTVGISVPRMRYLNVLIGGLIAGLGGAYFTLESTPQFEPLMTNGRGFIALAALIFGGWSPVGGLAAALLFGAASAFQSNAQQFGVDIPSHIIGMIPYVLTIIVVAGLLGRAFPPAAVGQPYETE